MKAVQPIRDMELLDKCLSIAREHDKNRKKGEVSWELLLIVGFNTSLRISDIRRFKVKDLRGKDYAEIKAQKTGKEARILINPHARRVINRLLAGRPGDEYILQSKQRTPPRTRYVPSPGNGLIKSSIPSPKKPGFRITSVVIRCARPLGITTTR